MEILGHWQIGGERGVVHDAESGLPSGEATGAVSVRQRGLLAAEPSRSPPTGAQGWVSQ